MRQHGKTFKSPKSLVPCGFGGMARHHNTRWTIRYSVLLSGRPCVQIAPGVPKKNACVLQAFFSDIRFAGDMPKNACVLQAFWRDMRCARDMCLRARYGTDIISLRNEMTQYHTASVVYHIASAIYHFTSRFFSDIRFARDMCLRARLGTDIITAERSDAISQRRQPYITRHFEREKYTNSGRDT